MSTALESLAFAIGDPGDIFVMAFPTYPRFASDISERAGIKLMGPALRAENNFMLRWILIFKWNSIMYTYTLCSSIFNGTFNSTWRPDEIEAYIEGLKVQGHNVKAYIHCNPNNPLGDVYNEDQNLALMKICAKHQMHFISDEIFALSIHNTEMGKNFKRLVFTAKYEFT